MKILETLTLSQAKELLRDIRIYADMRKKLGKRGSELFSRTLTGKQKFLVEYFPILGEDLAWQQAQQVFEKSFWKTPQRADVNFLPKEDMKGGMRVYVDDSMIDMSFTKVERLLQK